MESDNNELQQAVSYLTERIEDVPPLAVILGSGLGKFAENLSDICEIPYRDIPNFPVSTVPGHHGRLVFGKVKENPLIALKGRVHYYEGYDISQVTFPVRLLSQLGVKVLIITNASGSLNPEFKPGDFMLIKRHLNFTGIHLPGKNLDDNIQLFSEDICADIIQAGHKAGISLREGTYTWTVGPSYETPAEIQLIEKLGGDAVGMSTVPEAMQAYILGMKVGGISCLTNWAAGISKTPLNHEEVTETALKVEKNYMLLMNSVVQTIYENKLRLKDEQQTQ